MRRIVFILTGAVLLLSFQNCSKTTGIMLEDMSAKTNSVPNPEQPEEPSSVQSGTVTVDIVAENRMDILLVVDNSGSMKEIQANISSRVPGFIQAIDSTDWQIAVTTTDYREFTTSSEGKTEYWGNGNFRPLQGRSFLKKGDVETSVAQAAIADAIYMGVKGSGDERGIQSTYSAISKSASQSDQQAFFRKESRLVVILISDEDECSDASCLNRAPSSKPANLVDLVKNQFGQEKVFKFNSIVKVATSTCSATKIGNTYIDLSNKTGGLIGDVCSSDYTSIVSSIAEATVGLVKAVNLPCSLRYVQVHDMSGALLNGVTLSGNTVSLPSGTAEGRYTIDYICK